MSQTFQPKTAAEALLCQLRAHGVDHLFANAGTDFAPIIEAYAAGIEVDAPFPRPLAIPHETAAVAMAHGRYLVTGRPQAVMAHVNVGLANCAMGLINAASDNIPIVMMAGRTPITEHDRRGARMSVIQYGQEMRDQGAMVREVTKWDYELRYGEQAAELVDRAVTIAMSEPRGPVLLSLPREPLCEPWPAGRPAGRPQQAATRQQPPDPAAIAEAADALARAERPIIIAQRGDPEGRVGATVGRLADENAIPVIEFWAMRNLIAGDHPMHAGSDIKAWLPDADAVLVVDSPVPWIRRDAEPAPTAKVIHIGPDPLFAALPVRGFRADVAIAGETAAALEALAAEMAARRGDIGARHQALAGMGRERRAAIRAEAARGNGAPISPAYAALALSQAIDEQAVVFNELGVPASVFAAKRANQFFTPPFSGGLGWGVPAALGAALADPDRLAVACVGDGSYIFANPVACHQIAEALSLPVLVVVMNNGMWNAVRRAALNVHPGGKASRMNVMPLTSLEPSPSFADIARASRAHAERVEDGGALPEALERAIRVVREEKRQALLDLNVAVPAAT